MHSLHKSVNLDELKKTFNNFNGSVIKHNHIICGYRVHKRSFVKVFDNMINPKKIMKKKMSADLLRTKHSRVFIPHKRGKITRRDSEPGKPLPPLLDIIMDFEQQPRCHSCNCSNCKRKRSGIEYIFKAYKPKNTEESNRNSLMKEIPLLSNVKKSMNFYLNSELTRDSIYINSERRRYSDYCSYIKTERKTNRVSGLYGIYSDPINPLKEKYEKNILL